MVRSSANPGGALVVLSRSEWRAFLARIRGGAFDRLELAWLERRRGRQQPQDAVTGDSQA